ncbi:glycosyltransferase [Aquincola tertiaricarbonis]|uniref:glycosyltransferase n=1 Tax=Aquincola tertiaricarbonis TaxID=391953 RepID=UPI000614D4C9|nr:glycosyltransferase [Aquincola tertiaricarbonis]
MTLPTLIDGYCVLLCAHNGAAYLAEQLKSILGQTIAPARIQFFDDGSRDGTLAVAQSFADRLPLEFVELDKRRGGAAGAFAALLHHAAESPIAYAHYFLCDQDDSWEPFKAARLLERLARVPSGTPGLVHSELSCFGNAAAGRTFLHESLGHVIFESSPARPLRTLLFENIVVGASLAFNRALLERALPMPLSAFMHDWWLAIACVAHGGEIRYVSEPLVRYRIHDSSTVGRSGNLLHALPRRLKALRCGLSDPWLRSVSDQLLGLPFGGTGLPAAFFEPMLSETQTLFRDTSALRRYRAWSALRQHRIWAVASKDAYYKTRLFTDHVVRQAAL